ncbi:CinA family nicotinamide mononucleotide deamidase-related protein [Filimonas effusa]|uniref:CinA-like protein n=1 Tax=Filimonas effusa TaxID=2508721 RepID=A0A4Q1DE72_9BACT|nr:CinA family nicotinamide mononucleotide deamidase-related protein [Filimonas effusa]RXK87195.1 CinA family nicotinamide mononucleotide deamidase-related protein [Filimonas effusa]
MNVGNSAKVSIITIGDELLIGQVVDTNSAWMAQELNIAGFEVHHRVAVGDIWDDIWEALDQESQRSNVVLITGGLGPTADDITKPLLCQYFGGKLVQDAATVRHLEYLFAEVFRRPLSERNLKQADVPDVCTVLSNIRGTAPGMLFKNERAVFISMPGVPHEMKGLMTYHVIPLLQEHFNPGFIEHRTLLTAGIGESDLADLVQTFEQALPGFIKMAYLPHFGMVRLRLTARGKQEEKQSFISILDSQFAQLQEVVKHVLVVNEDISMQALVGRLLKESGTTLATAESCTGGYIAHLLTAMPGSSAYFNGSVVAYSNSIKQNVLQVSASTLESAGAVSEETVIAMAQGLLAVMQTNYAIAVSGIMGPDGGTAEKPVGTVWIAVGDQNRLITRKLSLRYDRIRNIELTATNALNLLRQFIQE